MDGGKVLTQRECKPVVWKVQTVRRWLGPGAAALSPLWRNAGALDAQVRRAHRPPYGAVAPPTPRTIRKCRPVHTVTRARTTSNASCTCGGHTRQRRVVKLTTTAGGGKGGLTGVRLHAERGWCLEPADTPCRGVG